MAENNTHPLKEEAASSFSKGHFDKAEQLSQQLLRQNPNDSISLERLGLLSLWKNNLDAAESFFKQAERKRSWFGRRWPFNTEIKYRLASTYLRAGRWKQASQLLNKAAGPLSVGPFKELKIRAKQAALFADEISYKISGPEQIRLPFIMIAPLPVVKISINGSAPVNFFIDTGGEELILDRSFAAEVNADLVGEIEGEYAGGKMGLTGYGKVERVELGKMTIESVPVTTLDLTTSTTNFNGAKINGVIGTRFLMQFLSTIDYPQKQLILRRKTPQVLKHFYAQTEKQQHHVFPMWLVETHLIFTKGSFNEQQEQMMFIDTGLVGGSFLSSREIFEKAGFTLDWSKAHTGFGGGGEVKALEVDIDQLVLGEQNNRIFKYNVKGIVTKTSMSIFNGALGFQVGGIISHDFFRNYALTFDFNSMSLLMSKSQSH